jgi:hypothetical protein
MAHYVITIDGGPAVVPDRDAAVQRLLITRDDGERRRVAVLLTGQSSRDALEDVSAEDAWRAAVFYAARELEILFRGEGWGIEPEGGEPFVIEAPGLAIIRFVGAHSSSVSLNDGAVVGEFGA